MQRWLRALDHALIFVVIGFFLSAACQAQEARGSITGRVADPQSALVPSATVVVTNLATNVARRTITNETGYYEVILLDPGQYSISVEALGFKKLVRSGITLNTGDRLSVDMKLEIGQTSTLIEVTADAPLLETTSASAGRVLNNRDIANLPFTNMNPFALQAMAAGMIYTGNLQPNNSRALDHAGSANFASGGLGTGANEFLLDGSPITGTNGGRAGYVPNSEAVDEVRIETLPLDASMGHAVGAYISATIKTGTNGLHGSGFWQTQQFRWNATPHFTRMNYESGLANGTIAPGTPKQSSGRVSQPGFGVSGPVYIPKVIDGRNKLFFYVSYTKLTSIAPPAATPIYTVPTEAMRRGDFSALLNVPTNPSQYIIYDPRTAKLVSGHVVRTPFLNNIIPPSMISNPIMKFYSQLYPLPNNPAGMVQPDGTQNFYDYSQANNDYFPDFINRIDYNINARHRINGRWYFNSRTSDQYDWAHSTPLKGVESNGLYRPTRGGSLDYLFTINAHNVLNITASISQYSEGSKKPIDFEYNAQAVGLPSYIDQKASPVDVLPWINIAGVANAASTSFIGAPGLNQRGTTEQWAIKMTTIKGSHTFRYGWEDRRYHYASVNPLGNTTGYYQFSNTYDRQADNTSSSATTTTGLGYASFLMGLPTSITLDTNDTGYWSTPYHAFYFQDNFRVTERLQLGFGLRFEREGGTTERFNRGLEGQYDFSYVPPYAQAVEAAYASLLTGTSSAIQTLQQGMPASSFKVAGGVTYLGQKYENYTSGTNRYLPNASVAYRINNKTVLRAGAGLFADTYNAMNSSSRSAQNGYSQTTSTILTSDNGLTFCCGVGAAANLGPVNPMMDPFPVLPSGSRWVMPRGNSLGSDILDGQGFTYYPRDYAPTRALRYSIGIQRELHGNHKIEVSYSGAYASQPFTRNLSPLPAQYWNYNTQWDANVAAVDNAMKATVANPFTAGLAAIKTTNPTLYDYLSNIGMFTGTTLQVQQLLRAYPNAGFSLNQTNALRGHVVDNEIRVMYTKRMSKGLQSNVQYAHMWGRQQWLPNQFDQTPAWQLNSNIRPDRLVWSAVCDLPFGKGRQWITQGPLQHVVGGWTLSWVYTYQTGPLISTGNLFYYGDVDQIVQALNHDGIHSQDIHLWFDRAAVWTGSGAAPSGFVGFEGRSANQPGTYQARIFQQYVDGLRADGIHNWDAKIARDFAIREHGVLRISADFLNLTNHTQFGAPNMTVTSSAFGTLSSQVNSGRIIQFNIRVQF
jgi:hypothetical protein